MTDPSPTTHAITAAAHASLELVNSSPELLSLSQLVFIKSELNKTLGIVANQIQVKLSDAASDATDLTVWESSSEAGSESEGSGPEYAEDASVGGSESTTQLLGVPGPYPMSPPNMDRLPECWYVVDCGTSVGIFANECADFAVAGVIGGHFFKVNSWVAAATLYNELHRQGYIICVPIALAAAQ